MSVSGIYNNNINISLHKSIYTSQHISCNANSSTAEQTSLLIFGSERIFDLFLDVLDGDKTLQVKIIIYNG